MTARDDFVSWARTHGSRLSGTEIDLPLSDLAPLGDIVGDARIVGLGESWHRIREFLAVRYRMTRFLVEQLNFSVVLLEGVLSSDDSLDAYVNDRGPEPELGTLWDTTETRECLQWLRSHNATNSNRVQVLGADVVDGVGDHSGALGDLVSYIERADPGVSRDLDHVRDAKTWRPELRPVVEALVGRLVSRRGTYTHRTSPEAFEWALHRAGVLLQQEDMHTVDRSVREVAMAENVKWALDRAGPASRVVLLSHIGHVGRFVRHRPGMEPHPSAGMILADWYGDEYLVFTTTFNHQGDFDTPHPQTGSRAVGPAQPDSIDQALHDALEGPAVIDLRAARLEPWLDDPRPLRTMEPLGWHLDCRFPGDIDAVVHTEAVHPS